MGDAGTEAARRLRAVRQWAGWFGLSLLALALSLIWLLAGVLASRSADRARWEAELADERALEAARQEADERTLEAERREAERRALHAERTRPPSPGYELGPGYGPGPGYGDVPQSPLPRWPDDEWRSPQQRLEAERRESQRREAALREEARRSLEAERRSSDAERLAREAAQREAEAWREAARQRAEARPPESREGQGGRLASIATIVTALGTFTAGIGTISALLLAWRAERRQAQEFQLKIRQLEHQVQELDAKRREEVRPA